MNGIRKKLYQMECDHHQWLCCQFEARVKRGDSHENYYSKTTESADIAATFTNSRIFTNLENLVLSSDTIFITTPDGVISTIWQDLSTMDLSDIIVCHFSGSLSSEIFSNIEATGAYGCSIHPMYAFSDKFTSYLQFNTATLTMEGDLLAITPMKKLFEGLGHNVLMVNRYLGGKNEKTVNTFREAKAKGKKLTMLTAYDYSTAKLEDEAGVDSILVGDSLGNVMLGYEDTISVTMEDMIHHGRAVARGAKDALVVIDMPFMSYQTSVYDAVVNAGRLMKEGRANAVKLEGGKKVCPQIKAITDADIPVCAHIGLTPQSINAFGGYKIQGKTEAAAKELIENAKACEAAGAALIFHPEPLAKIDYVKRKNSQSCS